MLQNILVSAGTFMVLFAVAYLFRKRLLILCGMKQEFLTPELAQAQAKEAAEFLSRYFGYDFSKKRAVAMVLGTGLANVLDFVCRRSISFSDVPGFGRLNKLEKHERKFLFGFIGDTPVITLQGRIHANENMCNPEIDRMLRLQTQVLMELGVKYLIVTSAAGALPGSDFDPGNLILVDSYLTVLAPDMPLLTGEFVSPEDTLEPLFCSALKCLQPFRLAFDPTYDPKGDNRFAKGGIHRGCYAMVRGPFFEGRKVDKNALRLLGGDVVGMSSLPEASVAALYQKPVIHLAFVTNGYTEEHSHASNCDLADKYAEPLGEALETLIKADLKPC